MKILFIGNSHTFVHYVPARVAHFCLSHGKPVETTMLTHPGMGLDWHLEQSQTYYNLLYGNRYTYSRGASAQRPSLSRPGIVAYRWAADHFLAAGGDKTLSLHDLDRKE